MHAIDPNLTSALAVVSATVLMVQSGVAKKLLSWRPAERRARRISRERRWSMSIRQPIHAKRIGFLSFGHWHAGGG